MASSSQQQPQGQDPKTEGAPDAKEGPINLKVMSQDGKEIYFKCKYTTQYKKQKAH